VTCVLVTPWWRVRGTGAGSAWGGVAATRILDWADPAVRELAAEAERIAGVAGNARFATDEAAFADGSGLADNTGPDNAGLSSGVGLASGTGPAGGAGLSSGIGPAGGSGLAGSAELARLRAAHGVIAAAVRPVYSVRERQPISRTVRRGRGSCSQRLAVLEGVARGWGIATRVGGLAVDGRFWYPRFPRARFLVPSRVVLAWPEFFVGGGWLAAGELFGMRPGGPGFANDGEETLFDAVARTGVDWDGCGGGVCDLSATVRAELGYFDSRDEVFRRHGQTLCGPLTMLADPVLSRWSPVR